MHISVHIHILYMYAYSIYVCIFVLAYSEGTWPATRFLLYDEESYHHLSWAGALHLEETRIRDSRSRACSGHASCSQYMDGRIEGP